MKNYYSVAGTLRAAKALAIIFTLMVCSLNSFSQTTYNFNSGSTLSSTDGFYNTQALVTIAGVVYKITHLGNGNFTNQSTGGNGNSAYLKKDGSGGDFLRIERNDGLPFQFYGMWLNTSSMNNPPYYYPPYYDIKYYNENSIEMTGETFVSSVQNETITVVKNLKVKYVRVGFNAIMVAKLDDLIVGPAAASVPTLTASGINQFTDVSAVAGGNVSSDGGAAVTERGIVYSTTATPTIADFKIPVSGTTGTFTQSITGLSSSTLYYVRSYATNIAGTGYSSSVSFTTAGNFVLGQVHYFNTSWATTTSQASPFTKYVEGWNITGTSSGAGLITILRLTSLTGINTVAEGAGSARVSSVTSSEQLTSVKLKTHDNSLFSLKGFRFKYLTKVTNTSFGTFTVTGYQNGVAVPGAVISLIGIAQATASSNGYTNVDLSANNNFSNIDEFAITASDPIASARLSAIDIDVLDVAPPSTLPLVLSDFNGKLQNNQSVLSWKTSQEQNTADFEVQYSNDGNRYANAGIIKAAGNSATTRYYSFTHNFPIAGNNYYRLKMNDEDGSFSYSPVINLRMNNQEMGLSIYPNPVVSDHFYVNTSSNTSLPLGYMIINADGKTIQRGTITTHGQKIKLQTLDKGNYFIQLSNGQATKLIL